MCRPPGAISTTPRSRRSPSLASRIFMAQIPDRAGCAYMAVKAFRHVLCNGNARGIGRQVGQAPVPVPGCPRSNCQSPLACSWQRHVPTPWSAMSACAVGALTVRRCGNRQPGADTWLRACGGFQGLNHLAARVFEVLFQAPAWAWPGSPLHPPTSASSATLLPSVDRVEQITVGIEIGRHDLAQKGETIHAGHFNVQQQSHREDFCGWRPWPASGLGALPMSSTSGFPASMWAKRLAHHR